MTPRRTEAVHAIRGVIPKNNKECGMRRNERKRKFFVTLAFAALTIVLVLGTTACVAQEEDSVVTEDIQGMDEEVTTWTDEGVVTETEEEVAAETETEMTAAGPSLSTDKELYSAGEIVTVLFTVDDTISADAFVGVVVAGSVPKSVETADYLATEKIDGMMSGELSFTAPADSGEYELRLVDSDAIVLTISFVVE